MRSTTPQKLAQLQKNPASVRNICILAHVDHGKTTLADALVASNGIISPRLAGKLRYMDSREDEQIRGITMKSSGISLYYQKADGEYIVNLIDSPGHVDFSSEVSTAVRLCDGALVIVDVVEGVSPQTHAVLRQAWLENIKPVLILNKIDRLITEIKMEPLQAYIHLQQILEQVNVLTSELFTSEKMEKTSNFPKEDPNSEDKPGNSSANQIYDWSMDDVDADDSHIFFSPDQGNVIFASALDGWGFSINHFAEMYAQKLGINAGVLLKTLWGDFYLNSKTKRVMKGAQLKAKKPLFVQCVLENLWAVYETVFIRKDKDKMEKIVKSLDLKIAPRDARHNDPRVCLQAICNQWLPLSKAVLSMVVEKLPSPLCLSEERAEKLMCSRARRFDSLPDQTQQLKTDFMACKSSPESPVIVFVSKMFAVDRKSLPENRQRPLTEEDIQQRRAQARQRHADKLADVVTPTDTDVKHIVSKENGVSFLSENGHEKLPSVTEDVNEDEQVFLAFARVFSGTIKKGQTLYVLGPKHDPEKVLKELSERGEIVAGGRVAELESCKHMTAFTVDDLYLFMGRELEAMDQVPAGNIVGIGGLDDHILKSATISSTVACPAFTDMYFEASPIVRVAIEPKHAGGMSQLVRGLKLLNQADPCVEVLVQETGEHVIIAAGEIHLQRCLDDLINRFAKIEINSSKPIVPFRETIALPPKVDRVNESIQDQNQPVKSGRYEEFKDDEEVLAPGLIRTLTSNNKCVIQLRALPLPDDITTLLEANSFSLKTLDDYNNHKAAGKTDLVQKLKLSKEVKESLKELRESLSRAFIAAGKLWIGTENQILSFGPRRNGPNVLVNRVPDYDRLSIWDCLEKGSSEQKSDVQHFESSIVNGFQLATLSGPLCEEPMRGVCFVLEQWEYTDKSFIESVTGRTSHSVRVNSPSSQDWNSPVLEAHIGGAVLGESTNRNSDVNRDLDIPENCVVSDSDSLSQVHCDKIETVKTREINADSSQADPMDSKVDALKVKRKHEAYGPFSGQLMSCVKDGCRKAFQTQPQRLVVAMYKCEIHATAEVLGKLYGVLGKRYGTVSSGDMKEGSQIFNIHACLPVIESFGFSDDIRKKTSGLARPQLTFSHWELIDIDPFWVPTTEEEYLHYGEKADSDNRARNYLDNVRRRKGLRVEEKLVEHAEKQRTLTKNK